MFCGKCGCQYDGSAKFCPGCGEKVIFDGGNADNNFFNNGSWQPQNGNVWQNNVNNNSFGNENYYNPGWNNLGANNYTNQGASWDNGGDTKFDGSGVELLGYIILATIICVVTCGIAAPWMICLVYKWKVSHTVINGKRFTFTGNGASLLGHWILWYFLTIITLGIYGFFTYVALRKWTISHTYIEGEPVYADVNKSEFVGNSFAYLGYSILGGLILLVTCGLAYPWVMAMLQKWDTEHQVINGRRFSFSGSGMGFLGEYLIIFLLSVITCGIYAPWGIVRINRYIVKHTSFTS